jgi:hypothetical protein
VALRPTEYNEGGAVFLYRQAADGTTDEGSGCASW